MDMNLWAPPTIRTYLLLFTYYPLIIIHSYGLR